MEKINVDQIVKIKTFNERISNMYHVEEIETNNLKFWEKLLNFFGANFTIISNKQKVVFDRWKDYYFSYEKFIEIHGKEHYIINDEVWEKKCVKITYSNNNNDYLYFDDDDSFNEFLKKLELKLGQKLFTLRWED